MAQNQQLSVLGQVAPATTGTAGQVLVSAGSSASSYWASAIPVSAYSAQFNGSTGYLSVPYTTAKFDWWTSDYTIECWIYPTSYTGWYYGSPNTFTFIVNGYGNTNYWCLGINSSGQLGFSYYNGSPVYVQSTLVCSLNTWSHIAFTKTSSGITLFVNGVASTTTAVSGTPQSSASVPLAIGGSVGLSSPYNIVNGYASNVRIVKGVAVYTGNFTPPTSPLGTAQGSGTNIAAVSASQTSLLTCNGPGFTDSSPNAATITNNGAVVSSQFAPFSSFSAISRSATQTQTILTSGSGTYYPPSGVAWLRVRMVGGGGGGGGGDPGGGNGSSGSNTTFGTSLLSAGGGGPGLNSSVGGAGGTSSIGSGATGVAYTGAAGGTGFYTNYPTGGAGGSSPFGGAGYGGLISGSVPLPGGAAVTNSGSGGGGGNSSLVTRSSGGGGAAGGYIEAYISNPLASYAYTIGTGGGGGSGSASAGAGAGGGSGIIIVEENYAVSVVKKSMTQTILTSGSGTYTTPIGVVQLEIRMVGGGGGGGVGGSAANGGSGSAGNDTTFGTSLLTAGGGAGGSASIGSGGSASIGSGATGIALIGGAGTGGSIGYYYASGAIGGASFFGGAGGGGRVAQAGTAATTNSGSGGGGGACYTNATGNNTGGGGGASGGYVEAYISSPAASYAYTVGAGGGGGAAGTSGYAGGGGGSGIIIIKEYY